MFLVGVFGAECPVVVSTKLPDNCGCKSEPPFEHCLGARGLNTLRVARPAEAGPDEP
jgi:hypothetical protein